MGLVQRAELQLQALLGEALGVHLAAKADDGGGLALAAGGLDAIRSDPHLAAGLNIHRGRITNAQVAESLRQSYEPAQAALAA